jgi:hypothetical protein
MKRGGGRDATGAMPKGIAPGAILFRVPQIALRSDPDRSRNNSSIVATS